MGTTSWSSDFYKARKAEKLSRGVDTFEYDSTTKTTKSKSEWVVHEKMNPKDVIRESRDSDIHPNSLAIVVLFDVTGSMNHIPRILQENLPKLMTMLIQKGLVEHPQILFGAIGDAYCDMVPLQIGQFESGIEMDEDLERIFLESGGGAHITETYELGAYFIAKKTIIDCYEKRGQKGYLFIIGDEAPYPFINKDQVKELIGDDLQENISTRDIFKELEERYNVFHLRATGGSAGRRDDVREMWVSYLNQNVINMDNPKEICELIALTIGINEGKLDLEDAPKVIDSDVKDLKIMTSLATYVRNTGLTKGAEIADGDLPVWVDDSDRSARL